MHQLKTRGRYVKNIKIPFLKRRWGFLLIKTARIIEKIDDSAYLYLESTYYEIDGLSKLHLIKQDVINSKNIVKLWQKKSFFENKKPNVKLVQQIGKKIKADAVLMLYFDVRSKVGAGVDSHAVGKIVLYLIDVKTGKLFSVKNSKALYISSGYFMGELNSYLTKVINDYVDYKY